MSNPTLLARIESQLRNKSKPTRASGKMCCFYCGKVIFDLYDQLEKKRYKSILHRKKCAPSKKAPRAIFVVFSHGHLEIIGNNDAISPRKYKR